MGELRAGEVGSHTESGDEELGDERLGAGSQGKVLGPWVRSLGWGGGVVERETWAVLKLQRAGGSDWTGQGFPMCEISGKSNGCEGYLGSLRTPKAGMALEELWEERAGEINSWGRQGLPLFRAARLGMESLF